MAESWKMGFFIAVEMVSLSVSWGWGNQYHQEATPPQGLSCHFKGNEMMLMHFLGL